VPTVSELDAGGLWWARGFRDAVRRLDFDFSSTDVCPLLVRAVAVLLTVIAIVCASDRGLVEL